MAWGLHGSIPGPLLICYGCEFGVFVKLRNGGSECVSDSFACSWESFPPIGLPCPAFALSCCILLCHIRPFFPAEEMEAGVDLQERGGKEERRENKLWSGCLENLFSKKKDSPRKLLSKLPGSATSLTLNSH